MRTSKVVLAMIIIMFAFVANSLAALDKTRLLVYWPCDDGSGDTVTDASGNGWDATILADSYEWVDGKYEGGLRLQKTNTEVQGDIISSTGDTGEITLMLWFIMYQHSTYNGLISISNPQCDASCCYRLMINPTKNPFWNMGHHNDLSLSSFTFELERWYHYAITGDGDTDKVYVDGELIGEVKEGFDLPDFDEVTAYIGTGESPGTWTVEDSTFDDVMIWDKALSQDEIQEVMEGGLLAVYPEDKLATTWSRIKIAY